MVKVHDGFYDSFTAVACMNACLLEYVRRGFLCSSYASPSTSSFDLSIHHDVGQHVPLLRGLYPSAYEVRFVNQGRKDVSMVTHMYFSVAERKEGEL